MDLAKYISRFFLIEVKLRVIDFYSALDYENNQILQMEKKIITNYSQFTKILDPRFIAKTNWFKTLKNVYLIIISL